MTREKQTREITSGIPMFPDWSEAWRRRALLWMFIRRNVKVRYTQTLLGSAWLVIQPLLLTGVLTLVVGMLLGAPSDGMPYALFAFTGSSIWNIFSRALSDTSSSFAGSSNLVLKVYFPRMLIPMSATLSTLVEFIPIFFVLVLTTTAFGRFPGLAILAMPLFLFLALLLAFSIGLWVTMVDAVYRDLRMVIPTFLQMLLFCSPVMYAVSAVPEDWRWLYEMNPLVEVLRGFRWSLVAGSEPPSLLGIGWVLALSTFLLAIGSSIFTRLEQFAVDKI